MPQCIVLSGSQSESLHIFRFVWATHSDDVSVELTFELPSEYGHFVQRKLLVREVPSIVAFIKVFIQGLSIDSLKIGQRLSDLHF